MRRFLILGAALLLAAPQLRADIGPRPGPGGRPQPIPFQAPKAKISIEVDEKATEPRLLVPIQLMFGGGGFGVGGVGFVGAAGAGGGAAGAGGAVGFGGAAGAAGFGGVGGGVGGNPGQKGNPPAGLLGGAPQAPPPVVTPPPGLDEEPSANEESKRLPFSTMMIGLALTLSFSTGGLWMARRKPGALGGAKPLGLLVAVLSIALLGGAAVWANRAPPVRPAPVKPPAQPQIPGPLPALLKMEGVKVELLPQGDTIRFILTKKHKETLKGKDATAPVEKPEEK
jgi:hypothetical protein